MRTRAAALAAVFVAAGGLVLPVSRAHTSAPPARQPADAVEAGADQLTTGSPVLRLVEQTMRIPAEPGTTIRFHVEVDPAGADLAAESWSVIVRAYDPVADRFAFDRALRGELGSVYDYVELPLLPPAGASATEPVPFELSVALELDERTIEALRLTEAGVYPVELLLTEGEDEGEDEDPLDQVITFVEREEAESADPAENPPADPLRLSIVASVDGGPARRPDGTLSVPDPAREQLLSLVQLLESVPGMPVTASLRPELLRGMASSGQPADEELVQRLRAAGAGLEVLANTYIELDPSAAQRAGMAEIYTDQLRLGEDAIAEALPGIVPRRTVWIADSPVDGGGAELLRDLGMRAAVLTPQTQLDTDDGAPIFADTTRQFLLQIPSGSPMSATDIDLRLAEHLSQPTDEPALAAYRLYAELAVIRGDIVARLEPLNDRSLVIATEDTAPPDPAVMAVLIGLLEGTDRFSLISLSTAIATTSGVLEDGQPLTFELPAEAGPDLSLLRFDIERYRHQVTALASMLPSGDPRPETWAAVLDVLPAQAWTPEERALLTSAIDADAEELRAALVLPEATRFTLGGRQSDLVVGIRNDGDTELRALVRLTSAKLRFPEGQQTEVFPPGELTRVSVPVEARTNGQFPVTVELVTPVGDLVLGPPVELTASVNALTGLGQLASGAALLVLATWWAHHWRMRRRSKRESATGSAVGRHPATGATLPQP